MQKEILEKNIYYYTNVIEDPQKLINSIEETEFTDFSKFISKWEYWGSCSGQQYEYGTEKTIYPLAIKKFDHPHKSKINYIFNTIADGFYRVSKDYAECLQDNEPSNLYLRFNIKKYKSGAHMGTHFDQQEGDERLKYSLVMYLNDDYEGGELSFVIRDKQQTTDPKNPYIMPHPDYEIAKSQVKDLISIKPKAGSVVIFPSYPPYHHTAHIVKHGYKYMIPTFCMY